MTKNPDASKSDDRPSDQRSDQRSDRPNDRQGGLPDDLGNEMSDRSGYYDESETGMTNTPIGRERPSPKAVPDRPKDTDNSGTTFDADTGTGREL